MTTVHCRLVRDRIDTAAVLAEVGREAAGASVLFVGTTRSITGDVVTRSLDYEAHEPLAEGQLAHLAGAAVQEFALSACAGGRGERGGGHERPASPRGLRRGRVAHGADQAGGTDLEARRGRRRHAHVGAS